MAIHSDYQGPDKVLHTPSSFRLCNILHAPNISPNLLSVTQFTKDNDVFFEFHRDGFVVTDRSTGTVLHHGTIKDGLYLLETAKGTTSSPISAPSISVFHSSVVSLDVWHRRLGHPADPIVSQVLNNNGFPCKEFDLNKGRVCFAYQLGKSQN